MRKTLIQIPELVRIKPGALDRMGIYLSRANHRRVFVLVSEGLVPNILQAFSASLAACDIAVQSMVEVTEASVERTVELLGELPRGCQAIVGLGGGKTLDTAKYVASLSGLTYYASPTSLSNDGFCSPQSSLTLRGRRRSLPTGLPYAVIVDTAVCLGAPKALWCSGIGDLVSKLTAVFDWKLAFHADGTPVNDLAALMSDATVYQFIANPAHDLEGMQLLATALLLNGVAMEVAGSSRPASGSEHLISHALDQIGHGARLHGLQVGVASYIVSRLQINQSERIASLFEKTGFWDLIRQRPFSKTEWLAAARLAPAIKDDYYTILSRRDCLPEIERLIDTDSNLKGCFE